MKTLKVKALIVTWMVTVSALLPCSMEASSPPSFLKEKADIQTDISNINSNKENIKSLKEKMKADKKADNSMAVNVDKKELTKRKADMRQGKAYLRADKKDLSKDHQLIIKEGVAALKEDQKKLNESEKKLKKSLASNNDASVQSDAHEVALYQKKVKQDKSLVNNQRISRNQDMLAANEEIRKSNTGFNGFTYPQTAFAVADNWMLK